MTKTNQDFHLYWGESKTIFVDLNNPDGSPLNPANTQMQWWLAKTWHSIDADDDGVMIKKSLGDGLTIVTNGVNIQLDAADTQLMPEIYYHELKLFLPGGGVSSAMVGTAVIHPALDMRPRPNIAISAASVSGSGTVT